MAVKNKTIVNKKTRQGVRFLLASRETNGQLLEMESSYQPKSKEPAPHYHPFQEEDFLVLKGELTVRLGNKLQVLQAGDTLHIPRNAVHSMWNDADMPAIVNWKVTPAMDSEYLLETATGLAIDGKTNADGMPNILQVALMANRFSSVFRLAKPPFWVQKALFVLLTPLAYLFGYKPIYQKYFN